MTSRPTLGKRVDIEKFITCTLGIQLEIRCILGPDLGIGRLWDKNFAPSGNLEKLSQALQLSELSKGDVQGLSDCLKRKFRSKECVRCVLSAHVTEGQKIDNSTNVN